MHPGHLLRALAAYRDGRYGDLAAYKAAASGIRARPGVAAALDRLDHPIPDIDLPAFRRMPADSLGCAYARFIDANGFQPLNLSATARERLGASSTLAVRYAVLHDAFHVLLGFGAGLPGELGVWVFVGAQDYAAAYGRAAAVATVVYPLVAPRRRARFALVRREALRMAREADCVIAAPFERYWELPLPEVRERLRIIPFTDSGA